MFVRPFRSSFMFHQKNNVSESVAVEIAKKNNSDNIFRVKFSSENARQRAILAILPRAISVGDQASLRYRIWGVAHKHLVEVTELREIKPYKGGNDPNKINIRKRYEIELDRDTMKRAYVYIDYPPTVMDGGAYYSIDLPAFLARHEKGRP